MCRDLQFVQDFRGPFPLVDIQKLCCGRICIFADSFASHPKIEKVRHGEQMFGLLEDRGCVLRSGVQLVQRIKWKKLNPGDAVNKFGREFFSHTFHHTGGSGISVMIWVFE